MGYRSVLFLDDVRVPTVAGVDHVRSFGEFVEYLRVKGVPELISFDHDLAREHYPVGLNRAGERIRYDEFREATGLHCARYVVEKGLDLRFWAVHSANVQGKRNIERELRAYRKKGEVRGVEIPFMVPEGAAELGPVMSAARVGMGSAAGAAARSVVGVAAGAAAGAAVRTPSTHGLGVAGAMGAAARGMGAEAAAGEVPAGTAGAGMGDPARARFSATSLLQFDEAFAWESWRGEAAEGSGRKR